MRHYPDRILIVQCTNCGAGPHEFCADDCPDSYRPDAEDDA
jgi:hypothetical protein